MLRFERICIVGWAFYGIGTWLYEYQMGIIASTIRPRILAQALLSWTHTTTTCPTYPIHLSTPLMNPPSPSHPVPSPALRITLPATTVLNPAPIPTSTPALT
jgi:hypothetical protein